MGVAKISSLSASKTSALDQLAGVLKNLQDAAENGKWEQIEELEAAFRRASEAVQEMSPALRYTAAYRNRVTELLTLHKVVMSLCKDRMDQIAPLINALSGAKLPSVKS
ncbi:flagellar protein FliT [Azonexus sp. IMCC34842]|uniref:flagellar protein FliT n=1 Tax=Azonexus sp. IMCC34842 TaxID=3420950 RepID=UPI003D09F45A